MEPLSDLALEFTRDPKQFLGVPIAIVGAVFLSLGAQYQHRGVVKVEHGSGESAQSGLNVRQMLALLRRPSWVVGTLMLGLAVVLQLTSLLLSPLTLVQPLGAFALVVTTIVNSRVAKVKLSRKSIIAVIACVAGVAMFVIIAATVVGERPATTPKIITILLILLAVIVVLGGIFVALRKRLRATFFVVAAGLLYGFVATLAKVTLGRITSGTFDLMTILCIVGLLAATGIGAYFVQNAYASGPPDLVIAGLTVIDPIVAVLIGIIVLDEADGASPWVFAGFIVAGAIAIWGVFQLARHHPQVAGATTPEADSGDITEVIR